MNFRQILSTISILAMALTTIGCPGGKQGPPGPAGASSLSSSRIVSTYNCEGTVSGLGGGAAVLNGIDIEYTAVVTAAGDVYASGNVIDDLEQTSATMFYASGQVGALSAAVFITADYVGIANAGFWKISVDRGTLVTSIQYVDSSLGIDSPVDLVFTPSACTVQNW